MYLRVFFLLRNEDLVPDFFFAGLAKKLAFQSTSHGRNSWRIGITLVDTSVDLQRLRGKILYRFSWCVNMSC